jgi:hypothetical protein
MNAFAVLTCEEQLYEQSRQQFEDIVGCLCSKEVHAMTHSEIERELEKMGRGLMRKLLADHLQSRSPGQSNEPVKGTDRVEGKNVRLHERSLETIFGTVPVESAGYGEEGSPSLHPLDAEPNLPPEKYSLEVCRRVAEEAAKAHKHKMGARLSKGEKKKAKRMATVATVYTINPFIR